MSMNKVRFDGLVEGLLFIKSAKEYSIHSASLDGDEFRIAGVSSTINSCYSQDSSLKLKFVGSGRKSAG